MGQEANPPPKKKNRIAPIVEHSLYWSRIRRRILRYFQILIVSAVKICEQYLQTALAPGDFVPRQTSYRGLPWTPLGDFRSPIPSGL